MTEACKYEQPKQVKVPFTKGRVLPPKLGSHPISSRAAGEKNILNFTLPASLPNGS